jgi:hypothetical protein
MSHRYRSFQRLFDRAKIVLTFAVIGVFAMQLSFAQSEKVTIVKDANGYRLQVDGRDFMVNGMNWDFFPRGTNYSYSLWNQPDDIIMAALDREMPLLRNMGVNTVRIYTGIQPRWVKYIHDKYGIYTVLNHSFGRYGLTIDGAWVANTDYADQATRSLLMSEVKAMAEEFKDVPGVLMFLLGNENNYGLFWGGAETEDIPVGETLESVRARHMYKTFNDGVKTIKGIDQSKPVAICNGDLLFIDIIAEEVTEMDIFGTNMYRGFTFTDAFEQVEEKLGVPIFFTEFGSDAYNAITQSEAQFDQAQYLIENWKDIYANAAGMGKVGNSIGGMTFQFSDGWWKYGQESNLDFHDPNASWGNGGYKFDYVEGGNNMNEEWFGICAKGPTDQRGLYELYPRAGYYALKKVHALDVYAEGTTGKTLEKHFANIDAMTAVLEARGDKAALGSNESQMFRVSGMRMMLETISTGGDLIETPGTKPEVSTGYPSFKGFDHMQSFFVETEARPAANINGKVALSVLGNVPENPIDEIFYENRGRVKQVNSDDGNITLGDIERVRVYRASMTWDDEYFKLDGFYRTGHYHWAYEGDFFGLYPEANYGPNIDIYNGNAPSGFEFEGKRELKGLKIAWGPELWWGANPAVLLKYRRSVSGFTFTGIYQEDLDEQGAAVSSFAVPLPPTRKASLHMETKYGPFGLDIGGLWSGDNKVGQEFGIEDDGKVLIDEIKEKDTFGAKIKLTYQQGIWNFYAGGALMGLVADGFPSGALTFTGWRLKDSGLGNQYNITVGAAITVPEWDLQIAPNFLYQKPLVGPIPSSVGTPRNILDDPFAVRGNRETTARELLLTYDPTPATWMYAWNSDEMEDAPFAISAGVIYRQQPTTMDVAIGIDSDGRTTFAFKSAVPARDVWEVHARIISKVSKNLGLIANVYAADGEPNGDDTRLLKRYGADIRAAYKPFKLSLAVKKNDWGPYDYHRDYNLTYPWQVSADLSTNFGELAWFDLPATRFGIRGTYRTLNEYSSRYFPTTLTEANNDPLLVGFDDGSEWEVRTYLHLNLGL